CNLFSHEEKSAKDVSTLANGDKIIQATKNSRFREVDLVLASYIFGFNYDSKEELVSNDHCSGTREALMTLKSGQPIVDDVLILVASMLTHNDDCHKWFLPTTFA
ncbi:hypothetical protein S245_048750, partial [Arachis hypogaea]